MSKPLKFKPELWKPIIIDTKALCTLQEPMSYPKKSFFDPQEPEETYEVRGILPRADIAFKEVD